jgi:hypothetical protein
MGRCAPGQADNESAAQGVVRGPAVHSEAAVRDRSRVSLGGLPRPLIGMSVHRTAPDSGSGAMPARLGSHGHPFGCRAD